MNETLRQLHQRKSVRVYTDQPVTPQTKAAILEAAIQAPTAGNMALYTILDITDPAKKAALAESCDHQPFIAEAPMVLVFCADYHRWYELFCRQVDTVRRPDLGDLFLAQSDALIAAQNAVVAAQSLGLGSCYIGDILENYEFHRELLNLPEYVVPAAMVCFGYPTDQQLSRPKPPRHSVRDLVHENGYDDEKAAAMEQMLQIQQGKSGEALTGYIRRLCQRKWNSDFSREMSRSCTEMVRQWRKDAISGQEGNARENTL